MATEPAPEIIMAANGVYWRRYPDGHLSMVPVSDDNDPVLTPFAVYHVVGFEDYAGVVTSVHPEFERLTRERDEARRGHVPLARLREWIEEHALIHEHPFIEYVPLDALCKFIAEYERTTDGD